MDSNPPASTSPLSDSSRKLESRRRRARQACAPCRSRKRKCNGQFPCNTCVEFEYECFYRETPRRYERKQANASEAAGSALKPSPPANETNEDAHASQSNYSDDESMLSDHNPFKQRAILDPLKIRYNSASSAVAFPRVLGLKLNHDKAPRLHSFAWHLGIRQEPQLIRVDLRSILTFAEAQDLAVTYWTAVHPAFGFIDRPTFERQLKERFNGDGDRRYDCIISGVLALGSFFSGNRNHPKEQDLVKLTQDILDIESTQHSPELAHAAGWILRVLYLRLASRPYAAWVASCTLMHLVEAIGLHKEIQTVAIISPAMPDIDIAEVEYRRRLAWLARVLNRLLSYEFSRNEVILEYTCHEPMESVMFPHALLQCIKVLPSDTICPADGTKLTHLKEALVNLTAISMTLGVHELLRADLVLCIFRRLWNIRSPLSDSDTKIVYAAGKRLISAVTSVVAKLHPWWSALTTPFQYLCALVAIDSPRSLSELPSAMDTLEYVAKTYPTHLSSEALETAKHLVMLSFERKSADMKALEPFLPLSHTGASTTGMSSTETIPVLPEIADSTFFSLPDDMFDWGYMDQNHLEIITD